MAASAANRRRQLAFQITRDGWMSRAEITSNGASWSVESLVTCDFCASDEPMWRFPARDIELDDRNWSKGGWAACETCRGLIDRNDRPGLATHARHSIRRATGGRADFNRIVRTHVRFFAARTGEEAQPLG